ncbi:TadE/TadG family type IV pilus assembly protein [Arthrobacter sp. A2-55]|uniref:TadE/TadG family type IV pilus assembly protein n=1 Tax=Arthrobacter sp. A2-55 TaxID=2897337 RepID=UPI002A631F17|nr:pilus assembly protein [Arthrobacter sp. A2-55]
MGIIEFGYLFNQQISASNAARAGARYAAVHYSDSGFSATAVQNAAKSAAPSLNMTTPVIPTYSSGSACAPGVVVTVKISAVQSTANRGWLIGFIPGNAPKITGIGVMQCGG